MVDRVIREQDLAKIAQGNQGDFLLGGILGSGAPIEDLGCCVLVTLDTGVEVPKGDSGIAFLFGAMAAATKNSNEGDVTV